MLQFFCLSYICSQMEIILTTFKLVNTLGNSGKWKQKLDMMKSFSPEPVMFSFSKSKMTNNT